MFASLDGLILSDLFKKINRAWRKSTVLICSQDFEQATKLNQTVCSLALARRLPYSRLTKNWWEKIYIQMTVVTCKTE